MLGVGEQFPDFSVTATVSTNKDNAFKTITNEDYKGKWRIFFFWPKDFTFVCPTEIAAFGKLNKEFHDRDAQVLGCSIDSEFVHLAWRKQSSRSEGPAVPHAVGHQARPVLDARHPR